MPPLLLHAGLGKSIVARGLGEVVDYLYYVIWT